MSATKEKTRTWLPANQRREQLLTIGIEVAARNGLGRTVHAEIAHKAGVAVSSVFLYFPNRVDLMAAIVEEVGRFYTNFAQSFHEDAANPLDAVKAHFHGFADSVETHPEYAQVWLEWSVLIRCEDGLWEAFLEFQETIIQIIAKSIRKSQKLGLVPNTLSAVDSARLLVASAYTTAQLRFMQRSKRMTKRYTDQALRLALQI